MPRIRSLKYEYFINEDLARISCEARLLGLGLTTLADREGRLEDRPQRIKALLFPYHDVDVDKLLNELQDAGFMERYVIENKGYLRIVNFLKHQKPHPKEAPSSIPSNERVRRSREKVVPSREKVDSSREKEPSSRVVFGSMGSGLGDLGSMGNGNGHMDSVGTGANAANKTASGNEFTVWKLAVGKLMSVGMDEQAARSFIGIQCKLYTKPIVADAITKMLAQEPADPKSYLVAILKGRDGPRQLKAKVEHSLDAVNRVIAEKEAQRDAIRR